MPYDDEKRVIFLHVPKTGGTTVKRLFDIRQLDDPDPTIRPSPQHLTCELLRSSIGEDKYWSYYKFAFVRNPWARLVSSYFWRQQLPKKRLVITFEHFVENARSAVISGQYYNQEFADHFIPQIEFTRDADDVFRFESFEDGLRTVAAKLGVGLGPLEGKPARPYDRYWEYYDNNTRSIIFKTYREEIEQFAYEFGTL